MSFKDALNKSAEAQKKLEEDSKRKTVLGSSPVVSSEESDVREETETPPVVEIASNIVKQEKANIKQFEGSLPEYLTEDELRDMSNRKTYQTYPTIHKMVKLACNKTGKDLITYVNEAILEQLKKDDIISLYEIVHGKLK